MSNATEDVRELRRILESRERRQRNALDATIRQLAVVKAIEIAPPAPTPLEQAIEQGQKPKGPGK